MTKIFLIFGIDASHVLSFSEPLYNSYIFRKISSF